MTSFSEEKEAAAILKTSDLLSRDCAFWAPAFHGKHRLLHGFTDQWPTSAFQGYLLSPDVQSWALPGPWASASHCSEQTSHLTQPSWKNQSLIFLSSGNQSFANKAKAVLQHSTAETELGTALLHRGMMANSDLQHPQATIQGAKAGSWGEGGSYKTVQFENRHKLQVSASKSRIQIPVLSFPALSSSLQVWKGGNAGKKWIPIHCFTKTKLQFLWADLQNYPLSQRLENIKFLLQTGDGSGREISYLKAEGSETKQQHLLHFKTNTKEVRGFDSDNSIKEVCAVSELILLTHNTACLLFGSISGQCTCDLTQSNCQFDFDWKSQCWEGNLLDFDVEILVASMPCHLRTHSFDVLLSKVFVIFSENMHVAW